MVKSLSTATMDVHVAKFLSIYLQIYGKGSTTRAMSARTLQAYGSGKGMP